MAILENLFAKNFKISKPQKFCTLKISQYTVFYVNYARRCTLTDFKCTDTCALQFIWYGHQDWLHLQILLLHRKSKLRKNYALHITPASYTVLPFKIALVQGPKDTYIKINYQKCTINNVRHLQMESNF